MLNVLLMPYQDVFFLYFSVQHWLPESNQQTRKNKNHINSGKVVKGCFMEEVIVLFQQVNLWIKRKVMATIMSYVPEAILNSIQSVITGTNNCTLFLVVACILMKSVSFLLQHHRQEFQRRQVHNHEETHHYQRSHHSNNINSHVATSVCGDTSESEIKADSFWSRLFSFSQNDTDDDEVDDGK